MNDLLKRLAEPTTQVVVWAALLLVAGVVLTPRLNKISAALSAVVLLTLAILLGMATPHVPLVTGTMIGALGLICLLPPSRTDLRMVGGLFLLVALGYMGYGVTILNATPRGSEIIGWVVFGLLSLLAVGSAVAMISSRSAVYSAIWFAMTLLATGGLFLYQGAQFLGVATVVVYAGAIVVTFLFVIMLAQPDGHATYDRISWGWFAKPAAALAAALLLGAVLHFLPGLTQGGWRESVAAAVDEINDGDTPLPFASGDVIDAKMTAQPGRIRLKVQLSASANATVSPDQSEALRQKIEERSPNHNPPLTTVVVPAIEFATIKYPAHDPQGDHHMAHLGGYLFSRHLIAVEVAGTLLLAALVGAVAMLSQGTAIGPREGESHV